MLGVRRPSLVRQMAFRQDSNDSDISIRHGHLAASTPLPDSPRPQKETKKVEISPSSLTVTVKVPELKKGKHQT
ncbi:unnamed protein product [Auanema sp. JU1783]|nr:unnamed protein product [Auanema sp. JU1783]